MRHRLYWPGRKVFVRFLFNFEADATVQCRINIVSLGVCMRMRAIASIDAYACGVASGARAGPEVRQLLAGVRVHKLLHHRHMASSTCMHESCAAGNILPAHNNATLAPKCIMFWCHNRKAEVEQEPQDRTG